MQRLVDHRPGFDVFGPVGKRAHARAALVERAFLLAEFTVASAADAGQAADVAGIDNEGVLAARN